MSDHQPHEPVGRTEYVVSIERELEKTKAAVIDAALIHAKLIQERDEARAEVERLRAAMEASMNLCSWECSDETYCGRCAPLVRALDREQPEPEVELLKDHAAGTLCIRCDLLQVERDEARAETQRLIELNRSHVATLCEAQRNQVEVLKAEVERLRDLIRRSPPRW